MQTELNVITKSMEKLVRESIKRDNDILELKRHNEKYNESIKELVEEITGLRQELNGLRQEIGTARNQLELVSYENAHEHHLNNFMQEESAKDATDFAMTPTDIARGNAQYNNERTKYNMRQFRR